ncbi:Hypothetical protein NGAL_HAMBI1189_28730 [Neorhizobium galegae bv. officinalis]|uniref:Uncharacterized protein n=1 Tax=Neorhizobium galegae bv. officinalis TaxID=323656 RepID=A0A0T7GPR1_NEOGA|nr:Hypothetical protein NGAL_HAMBI1189_28730 [Neorhizobium galegae bv. officinalis]
MMALGRRQITSLPRISLSETFANALAQMERRLGFGRRGQCSFGTNNVKRAAVFVGAAARYSINMISYFTGSLLLRVHPLFAFNRIDDSAAC